MTILVTGAAGFIGSSVSKKLMEQGHKVVGIDNLNDYYDVTLKEARLARLQNNELFTFYKVDIKDKDDVFSVIEKHPDIEGIIHLAAQAGVRYSLINPYAYVETNVMGHLVMLEAAIKLDGLKHFVYASSSSVYGANDTMPFNANERIIRPVSLYAATKASDELMTRTYSHLHGLPATGLRFFTVYGPWGRPDMAAFLFTKAILAGEPIEVFNSGDMRRDFTYIDDIVSGVIATLYNPPESSQPVKGQQPTPNNDHVPHRVYNLGNNNTESLMDFIGIIEKELGVEAQKHMKPLQAGDVPETYADIDLSRNAVGFEPKTRLAEGLKNFVAWYRDYYKV